MWSLDEDVQLMPTHLYQYMLFNMGTETALKSLFTMENPNAVFFLTTSGDRKLLLHNQLQKLHAGYRFLITLPNQFKEDFQRGTTARDP